MSIIHGSTLPKYLARSVNRRRRIAAAVLACFAALLPAAQAIAADWPTKPVRIIYNYPAGTGGDVVSRVVAEALSQKLGQPFIVENRSGAAGAVGIESAARLPADGYTFLHSPNAPLVLLPLLRKVAYEPQDFRPIAALGEYVYAWAVLPSLGVKTFAEMVAMAKAKPGQLSYSSPGAGSVTNLRGEALNQLAGMNITHIPYRGGPDALNDFLAGIVNVMLDNAHFSQVRAGKAIMLAVTTSRRHPDFPDVPSIKEAGYDINLPAWLAVYAIKGTDDAIAAKMGAAIAEIIARPEIKRRLLDIGFFAMEEKPAELLDMNKRELADYAAWVKRVNFKID